MGFTGFLTNKVISKDAYIEKSPLFAFTSANPPECGKEGDSASLWQRSVRLATEEVRRDFFNNVVILMALLVT
jgi:hypothetical protein